MSDVDYKMETDVSKPAVPAKKARYRQKPKPGNSRGKADDAFRLRVGKKVDSDYRAQQTKKFTSNLPKDLSSLNLKTPIAFSLRPVTTMVKRLPFSTIGFGLTVSELYFRFIQAFRSSECSIYSLYRTILSQFDLQRQVSVEGGCSVYPYDSLFVSMDNDRRDLTKAHPDNFKILIYILESFGKFKHGNSEYITSVPSIWKNPFFLTFSDVPRVVGWLADPNPAELAARLEYMRHNPLPGAIYHHDNAVLINPGDFWPDGFAIDDLRQDFVQVTRLLEGLKTKFEQAVDRASFSGVGKSGCLVSVRAPTVQVPYSNFTPVMRDPDEPQTSRSTTSAKRRKNAPPHQPQVEEEPVYEPRPLHVPELCWYSSEPIESLEASLGVLTFSGVTTEMLEQRHQMFRVRSQFNSVARMTETWTAVFDEAIPRLTRT